MSTRHPTWRHYAPAALLAALAVAIGSCSPNDPQNTLAAAGEVARKQQDLFWIVFAWAVGVFVVVEGLLLVILFKFRDRAGRPEPPQIHGNTRLELAWTVAPALVLASIAVPTVTTIFDLAEEPAVALRVTVIGHQWWWEFQYPDLGVTTANELHLPAGETVDLTLESRDVIHSFWVPKLGGKTDVIPGDRPRRMWLKPEEVGEYLGQCAELCGIQHAQMRFKVHVQSIDDFNEWVRDQRTPPGSPSGDAARGKEIFESQPCAGCHTIQGTRAAGVIGPNLTHVGSRSTIAAGILENTPENMARWIRDPQEVKVGNLMPDLNLPEDQIQALVAYLRSLE